MRRREEARPAPAPGGERLVDDGIRLPALRPLHGYLAENACLDVGQAQKAASGAGMSERDVARNISESRTGGRLVGVGRPKI